MYTASKDKEDIQSLKNTAQNLKDNANAAVAEARGDLRVVANRAGSKVRDFIYTAKDELGDVSDKVTSQIRHKPVQSSAIALGVGFILGSLFRR